MNRSRMIVVLLVAVVVGLLASTFVYRQMTRISGPAPALTGHIVVATGALSLGARLEAANLRLLPWDAKTPVPGMFTKIEDCVNRVIITSVIENEPILEGKLAPKDSLAGLPATGGGAGRQVAGGVIERLEVYDQDSGDVWVMYRVPYAGAEG